MDHRLHGLLAQRAVGVLAGTKDFAAFSGSARPCRRRTRTRPSFLAAWQSLRDDPSAGFDGKLRGPYLAFFLPDLTIGATTASSCTPARRWWGRQQDRPGPASPGNAEGWLILYHGVRITAGGCCIGLDWRCWTWMILVGFFAAATNGSLPPNALRASATWGVVFPCGWILDQPGSAIRLYYGGADTCLALATAQLSDLLGYLHTCPRR